jgi:hypothetical protein
VEPENPPVPAADPAPPGFDDDTQDASTGPSGPPRRTRVRTLLLGLALLGVAAGVLAVRVAGASVDVTGVVVVTLLAGGVLLIGSAVIRDHSGR